MGAFWGNCGRKVRLVFIPTSGHTGVGVWRNEWALTRERRNWLQWNLRHQNFVFFSFYFLLFAVKIWRPICLVTNFPKRLNLPKIFRIKFENQFSLEKGVFEAKNEDQKDKRIRRCKHNTEQSVVMVKSFS